MRENLEQTVEHLRGELVKIRAGRASIELLEGVMVDAYDTKLPLNQVANLSSPEPRAIAIQPWDKTIIKNIESALKASLDDVSPVVDGEVIRIFFPPPTEERRHELVRNVAKIVEDAKVSIRQVREDELRDLKDQEDKGEISEDELHRKKDEVQKMVDEYNVKVEEMRKKKEGEIMTI